MGKHKTIRKQYNYRRWKRKESITQRIKEAKVLINNKKQLLCSNNHSLEIKKKLISSCICSVTLYGSETGTVGKNEERVINVFETWRWRRVLKIKWTDRIRNDEFFKRTKEERLALKIKKKLTPLMDRAYS